MPEDESTPKKPGLSADKLIQGVLSKLGETFDALLGRSAKASSTLATSEIAARARKLLDSQVRDMGENGRFVPHLIKLKVEWERFATDDPKLKRKLDEDLKTLENEILAALIDHINDSRYLTYAPLRVTAKPDYFTQGIHIVTSFGEIEKEDDEVDLSVTMPNINIADLLPPKEEEAEKPVARIETVFAKFSVNDAQRELRLRFEPGERLNVGRTRENDLSLEDGSVSKLHAALSFNSSGELVVADTGSTNGTFINKVRLAYGRAFPVKRGDMVSFGNVNVFFERVAPEPESVIEEELPEEVAPDETAREESVEEEQGPIRIELGGENATETEEKAEEK